MLVWVQRNVQDDPEFEVHAGNAFCAGSAGTQPDQAGIIGPDKSRELALPLPPALSTYATLARFGIALRHLPHVVGTGRGRRGRRGLQFHQTSFQALLYPKTCDFWDM